MQITANFKTSQSDCLQSQELYRIAQTISSFFTPLNHSYSSKFLVLKQMQKDLYCHIKIAVGRTVKHSVKIFFSLTFLICFRLEASHCFSLWTQSYCLLLSMVLDRFTKMTFGRTFERHLF